MKKKLAGRIAKPFGAHGELMVNLYDGFPQKHDPAQPVWVVVDGLDVPLFFEKFERRGRTSAVVAFADIDTPRRSAELVGKELFVAGSEDAREAPDGDEFYMEDLVGYKAHLDEGVQGVIEGYVDNDLNPLWRVMSGGREVFIPAVDEFIEQVDERRREVRFSLPEGLLTLND